eukprot:1384557-Amphidinium_carterae.1
MQLRNPHGHLESWMSAAVSSVYVDKTCLKPLSRVLRTRGRAAAEERRPSAQGLHHTRSTVGSDANDY